MAAVLYYMLTFAESVTSVFGLRFPYEQPHYAVIQTLGHDVQVRRYEPREAVEATIDTRNNPNAPNQAFQLLFNYITGANRRQQMISMTVPVRMDNPPEHIAMTVPVQAQTKGQGTYSMRFFLPESVVKAGAPEPTDPRLRLIQVPADTIAAIRYSFLPTQDARQKQTAILLRVLSTSDWKPQGEVFQLNYDPPFTIPFLRRNEMTVVVSRSVLPGS